MSNEELPDSAELASAYLDGELDAAARAAAAADPELMTTVDSFTRVRASLSEIEPVVPSTKTAALAAALAEFDAIHAHESPAAATTTNVVSLQSRRMRMYRAVAGVAAALVIGVVALGALDLGGGEDKSASVATDRPLAADTELPKIAAAETESAPAATEAPSDAAGSTAPAIPAIDTTAALTEFAASVEVLQATTAATAAPAATSAAPAPNGQDTTAAAGGYTSVACLTSDQSVLGQIIFRGTPAVAVRDTTTGSLQAVATDDCRVLVEVEAP